jgi:hypothetical protein
MALALALALWRFAIGQAQLLEDDEVFRCSLAPRTNTHVNGADHSSGGIENLIGEFIARVSPPT